MSETILAAEPTIPLAALLGVLAAMAVWEVAPPRRRRGSPRVIRWTNNLALVGLDRTLIQPLCGPASGGALDPRITTKEGAE